MTNECTLRIQLHLAPLYQVYICFSNDKNVCPGFGLEPLISLPFILNELKQLKDYLIKTPKPMNNKLNSRHT